MKSQTLLIVCLVLFAIFVLWYSFADKPKKVVSLKGKLYGAENQMFLQYPQVNWQAPSEQSLARLLFATAWNATSAKLTTQRVPPPPDFDIVQEIKPNFSTSKEFETYALFLHSSSKNVNIIAFGGTETAVDWITDVTYDQVQPSKLQIPTSGLLVHQGFYDAYASVQQQLIGLSRQYPGDLYITGYSLGGGLAQLCILDFSTNSSLKKSCTFAAPRCVSPKAADTLKHLDISRYANSEDIVPELPPSIASEIWDLEKTLFYEHIGTNYTFTDNKETVLANHSTAYRERLGF
ncbi:class 3 lipase [Brazilian marseillevirus]|uniref:esterase/lipase n=1 Tax=Brazilian marseillevirus TaxID=1813599 RepID=UPI0007828187|nr:esterase/lipase [Brazilian marseillevirus]AMQ10739.1 class 3 lipase [Brazilian marseillevirus]